MSNKILIGCEAFVKRGDEILLGLRKNCFGAGTWGLPGGHLEFQETLVKAIQRELKEEIGVTFARDSIRIVTILDDIKKKTKRHYIHNSFEIEYRGQEIKLKEPERCEEWKFFPLAKLPKKLFTPHKGIIKNYLSKVVY